MNNPTLDSRDFRYALATFATGVTVVTTIDRTREPRGFTANSFTSVSLFPPLILVCLSKRAATCDEFSNSGRFAVNILSEQQQKLSALFASPVRDRFSAIEWQTESTGCPIIGGVTSWFDCETNQIVDAGDHIVLIGEVAAHGYNDSSPLVYCSCSYVQFDLARKAMEAASTDSAMRVSAIVDVDGGVLLRQNSRSGKYSLPSAARAGAADEPDSLIGQLAGIGLALSLSYVCSVYENTVTGTGNVVYRGRAESAVHPEDPEYGVVSLSEIPWDDLVDEPLRILLRRYIREREQDAFGVYVGDELSGEVQPIKMSDQDFA